MSLIDQQLLFEDNTSLTATRNGTNVLDLGTGGVNTDFQGGALRDRNLGAGEDIQLHMQFAITTATTPTIVGTLKGADDAAITSNVVTIEVSPTLSPGTVSVLTYFNYVMRPNLQKIRKRYFRLDWTIGATLTTCTALAALVLDTQTAQPTMQQFP